MSRKSGWPQLTTRRQILMRERLKRASQPLRLENERDVIPSRHIGLLPLRIVEEQQGFTKPREQVELNVEIVDERLRKILIAG